jgi:hypothetical protein
MRPCGAIRCGTVNKLFKSNIDGNHPRHLDYVGILRNRFQVQAEGNPAECSVLHKKDAVKHRLGIVAPPERLFRD